MQGFTQRGRIPAAGILDLNKHIRDTISAHLQWSWNFTEIIFGINKKYWIKELPEGATLVGTRHQGAPGPPGRALVGCALLVPRPVPIFWYIITFDLEKIRGGLSGWSTAVSRRNLGRSTFALRRSDSASGTSLPEGKSKPSSSPTPLSSLGGQYWSTSSTAPSPLKP